MGRRASLRIRGKVQGVFFRESSRQQAERLGLAGFVRNLPGGEVEALVEGPEPQVTAFIDWCRQGPPAARVDGVEVREEAATGELSGFRVEGQR